MNYQIIFINQRSKVYQLRNMPPMFSIIDLLKNTKKKQLKTVTFHRTIGSKTSQIKFSFFPIPTSANYQKEGHNSA